MGYQLREALRETLINWQQDIDPAWQNQLGNVALDYDAVGDDLNLEPWEPIFPSRRHNIFPGEPDRAHMLRAFDGISPDDVRCVILGQDPYPCPAFSTGRAFEAGNVAQWRELDKMFSKSIRAFIQLIVAARTGLNDYATDFSRWPVLLADIEAGRVDLENPEALADRWVNSGVLLLNPSLTLSRFKVELDDHQSKGHLVLWRPLMLAVLRLLVERGKPTVFLGFGDAAAETFALAGLSEGQNEANQHVILRAHPAFADDVLGRGNPFTLCNQLLEAADAQAVSW